MQSDQDIAIQITIKGVRLCITIESDEPHAIPVMPIETIAPNVFASTIEECVSPTKTPGVTNRTVKEPVPSKIQNTRNIQNQPSQHPAPITKDAVIKGYRVKVQYDDTAPSKQELLKTIIQTGKKF